MFLFAVIAIDSAFHAALQRLEICRPRLIPKTYKNGSFDLQKFWYWNQTNAMQEWDLKKDPRLKQNPALTVNSVTEFQWLFWGEIVSIAD